MTNGVFVVQLHPDIAEEQVVWTFTSEALASAVVDLLRQHVGEAWYTYEPVSSEIDNNLVDYMRSRLAVGSREETLALLKEAVDA